MSLSPPFRYNNCLQNVQTRIEPRYLDDSFIKCNAIKMKTSTLLWRFVFALPIFTASHPATIVGVHVLNFCVRDGNRWTHMTINTNSFMEEF